MTTVKTLTLLGASSLCFALALSSAALAQSEPQTSSPEERAQTQQLNQNITDANHAADTQSKQNNARYQSQQRQYQANEKTYQNQTATYEAARGRYAAERARYRRGTWPSRYEHSIIVDNDALMGASVHTYNGHAVGRVEEIARTPGNHVDALRIALYHGHGDVWVDSSDLRFDVDEKVVMTDLDRGDLRTMARERF